MREESRAEKPKNGSQGGRRGIVRERSAVCAAAQEKSENDDDDTRTVCGHLRS